MKRTPMKASSKPLARKTPMKRGGSQLVAKKPMARGSVALARNAKPIKARSKTNSNPRPKTGEAELCRGQPCYLRIPGVCIGGTETTVPCHSNQARDGKSMGMKAHDKFTVPGCSECHRETDQGKRFTRDEKFAIWNRAFADWAPTQQRLLAEKREKQKP